MTGTREAAGRVVLEGVVEYGNRRGWFRPSVLTWEFDSDTGQLVLRHPQGRFRIEAGVPTVIRAFRQMNGRPAQVGIETLPATWDDATGRFVPSDPNVAHGLAGEIWIAIGRLAAAADFDFPAA